MKIFKILTIFTILSFFSYFLYSQNIPKNIPSDKVNVVDSNNEKKDNVSDGDQTKKDETKKEEKVDDGQKDIDKTTENNKDEKKDENNQPVKEDKIDSIEKTLDKENLNYNYNIQQPKRVKNYTEKGIIEIGGISWFENKALRSGNLKSILWTNDFIYFFILDYFLMGIRVDFNYNFTDSIYKLTGYYVIGGAFPVSNSFFIMLSLNSGYSQNNYETSKLLFSYGNELSLKIKLKDHFLMSIGIMYSFYTDFSQEFFNDKLTANLSFSGYF
ncbi:MAG TPA: hypothetical protein PKW55_00450 [Spirochaetota bacterium]|nr:hypothetical protein [Spirochaetota bacterium]HOM37825.1 hypothetical protein [Spirochaetota bacterium]HPQ49298.1 hypothetical protein [Spirochaetota bacterium]